MPITTNQQDAKWSRVMTPQSGAFRFNLSELWSYRDLIMLFVRRDFIAAYKQTILGPLWHIIQPLFLTAAYAFIGGIAKIDSDGFPRVLFVLTGVVIWNYFATCLTKTSNTFVGNAHIFGKVYFPRLSIPVSIIISNLMSFFIQFLLIVPFLIYNHAIIHPNIYILAIPFLIIIIALMGLGAGIIVSSLTIKYRDLAYFVTFGVQLAVYTVPVIYPLSFLGGKLRTLCNLNPLTPVIEVFRYALLGKGTFTTEGIIYSGVFSVIIMFIGLLLFNRVEKDFMDTV